MLCALCVPTFSMSYYLSIILFTPLAGALLLLLVNKQNENAIRWIANAVALIGFVISIPLWFWFNPQSAEFQMVERAPWIPSIGASFFLGVDGLSTLLILLTTMMGFIGVLSSWTAINERPKEYFALFLALETGMLGVFVALDFFLFYIFWEVILVPMYFLIGIWGGPRRRYAAIKFFLYTLVGSVAMLLAIIGVYFHYHEPRHVQHPGAPADAARRSAAAVVGVPRVLPGVRDQGADVAVPYMAARRARRSADRRQRHPGGHPAEARRIRIPADRLPDAPRGGATSSRSGSQSWR